jgi:hypothetical protein
MGQLGMPTASNGSSSGGRSDSTNGRYVCRRLRALRPPQGIGVPAICVLKGTNGEWIR